MWELRLYIAVRTEIRHKITQLQEGTEATGVAGVIGNKGGVGVAFRYERTYLAFICAHLAAHQEKLVDRNNNFYEIIRNIKLHRGDLDATSSVCARDSCN